MTSFGFGRATAGRLMLGLVTAGGVVATAVLVAPPPASAISADIVLSQVYGGGGNTGAPYANDFVELYNRGTSTVSVAGWSVQYASATGSTWSSTLLSGTIAPGRYLLVAEAAGSNTTAAPLPTPDVTGTTPMSATAGKVALVAGGTPLVCATDCATAADVRDLVGYGSTASAAEGAPAPNLSNATAALRNGGGAADTDNNAADFGIGAPNPRNSSSSPAATGLRIHQIQGPGHTSPLAGRVVADVPGVVAVTDAKGFWMQEPRPDRDPRTSEGLYVYLGSSPGQAPGDRVAVTGTVSEYRAGGTATNLTITEIVAPLVATLARGVNVPSATLVGRGGRIPPGHVIENDATGDVEASGVFDPATDGIDFWESLEGMLVRLDDAAVVGPRNTYGEIAVVPAGSRTRTSRGGIILRPGDDNPERIIVDGTLAPTPSVDVGDTLAGATIGVVSYAFGNFHLVVTATPAVRRGGIAPEIAPGADAGQLAVATFNVENLSPLDPQARFDRLAAAIVTNLAAPDLIAVEEIQDDSGQVADGTVTAERTLALLAAAIARVGGPAYMWRQVDPVDGADGGAPGGNIRQAFLFRTDRGLSFVDRPGATATTATSVTAVADAPTLTLSPGRIDPGDPAFANSRKPLAGEFSWRGRAVFVVANHFNSKGGDQPLYGRYQPPSRPTETQRHAQASVVRGFVDRIRSVDPDAAIVVLGDLNDFEYSQTVQILTAGGALVDLPATLPVRDRYTYVYEGNSQVLDHILLSGPLAAAGYAYRVVHINSEFADQASDHDPQVVLLASPDARQPVGSDEPYRAAPS